MISILLKVDAQAIFDALEYNTPTSGRILQMIAKDTLNVDL